jgi:predicted Fe-Mo cluster-binding NifX family protein
MDRRIKMKIAISSDGEKLHSKVDQRFGRCPYFLIVNVNGNEVGTFEAVTNEGTIQGHGAGIKSAEQIGELGVKVVITGNLGPNATAILEKLDIKTYHASGTIQEAIENFVNNKLEEINEISESHSGIAQKKDKEEKIFFPLLNNKGEYSEISQHFGHAPFFGLYNVEKKELKIIENDLDHTDPNESPIDQIEKAVNPTTIFAKGIGGRAIELIAEKGLSLKTGNYKTVKEVIKNLDKLDDQIESCGHEKH